MAGFDKVHICFGAPDANIAGKIYLSFPPPAGYEFTGEFRGCVEGEFWCDLGNDYAYDSTVIIFRNVLILRKLETGPKRWDREMEEAIDALMKRGDMSIVDLWRKRKEKEYL